MTMTKRRKLRHAYAPHRDYLDGVPLCIRRRRAGLPRHEDRTLVLIHGNEATVLFDPNAPHAEPGSHRCFEVTTPNGAMRIHGDPNMDEETIRMLAHMMDLAYEQYLRGRPDAPA